MIIYVQEQFWPGLGMAARVEDKSMDGKMILRRQLRGKRWMRITQALEDPTRTRSGGRYIVSYI